MSNTASKLLNIYGLQTQRLLKTPQLGMAYVVFFCAAFILCAIVWSEPAVKFQELFPLFSTIIIFIASAFSLPTLVNEDMKLGVLEFMQSQNLSIEKYIASIVLSYTVVIILPPIIIGSLLLILSGLHPLMAAIIAGVILLCSTIVVNLVIMATAFCSDADNHGSMVGFLAFPMVVPAFLMADAFFAQFVKGFYNGAYVLFLFGLLLVSFGISIITSAFGIRLALR